MTSRSVQLDLVTMGDKTITKIILETISICNRTNKKITGKKIVFGLVSGNFENSKVFEGLVILRKKQDKSNRKKKVHRIIESFFYSSRCAHAHDRFSVGHCGQSLH